MSNKTLLMSLRKHLHLVKGKWVEELLGVCWAYRTTSGKATRVSPFTLTYGMEAIIPIEIGMSIIRMEILEEANVEALAGDLDMKNEIHKAVVVSVASYQQRTTNLYNRRVRQCAYQAEDLVLRRVFENTTNLAADKFQPNWEGPYTMVRVGPTGLYVLDKLDGMLVPRMWNATHLKWYYQ